MTEKMLHVILTTLSRSPIIFLEQILTSEANFKLLSNEDGSRYQKKIQGSKSGHSTKSNPEMKIFQWRGSLNMAHVASLFCTQPYGE